MRKKMSPAFYERIAENLIALRKTIYMNQSEVAKKLRISRDTYCKFEQGEQIPRTDAIHKLAGLYCVAVDTLINCDVQSVLTEHFLRTKYSDDEMTILSVFTNLTDFSKGRLVEYAEDLAYTERKKKQDSVRIPL